MRKFYTAFYNEFENIVTTTILLGPTEKANEITIQEKINEKYFNDKLKYFCVQVLSWSLIEEYNIY